MKPLLVLNTAWMRDYRGDLANDPPVGKFEFMLQGGTPHEIFNFCPTESWCYGYAPVRGRTINLKRLDKNAEGSLNGVLVVWTASKPSDGGRYIVGWYDGATVYSKMQERPHDKRITEGNGRRLFCVKAPEANCRLLPVEERTFFVPSMKKGFAGTTAAFFPEGTAPSDWVLELRDYIENIDSRPKRGMRYRLRENSIVDPEHRQRVERAAIQKVVSHYKSLGYNLISQEADNVGWDLQAISEDCEEELQLEVKGLSGRKAVVELTPNEYRAMTSPEFAKSYRLCIVTSALDATAC